MAYALDSPNGFLLEVAMSRSSDPDAELAEVAGKSWTKTMGKPSKNHGTTMKSQRKTNGKLMENQCETDGKTLGKPHGCGFNLFYPTCLCWIPPSDLCRSDALFGTVTRALEPAAIPWGHRSPVTNLYNAGIGIGL